jgi:hypothetical protein
MKIKFEILNKEIFTAAFCDIPECALAPLGGYYHGTERFGLGCWTIHFEIEVTKFEETKNFLVAFQPEERPNGLMQYFGYELVPASHHGYDADESEEVINFCDGDYFIINELLKIAEKDSAKELESLLEYLSFGLPH